ncbi:hypothetical protein PG994_015037 [Apiospora phragmitis]|uniref:Uncharacterized protein n=1 Tax=Apiospora phragmitis TaxID=2905665 RepID=A0ABR1SX50_9PEZI
MTSLHNGLNLDLPPLEHELVRSRASPPARLEEIGNIPQDEWEEYSMETQCVRPAQPTADLGGRSLAEVVAAHAAMDKELEPTDGGAANAGWYPHIFVVVTNQDIEDHGLLLVYVDNPFASDDDEGPDEEKERDDDDGSEADDDDPRGPTLRKFFFLPKDMASILSGIALSEEDPSWMHKTYDLDREHSGDTDISDAEDMDEELEKEKEN